MKSAGSVAGQTVFLTDLDDKPLADLRESLGGVGVRPVLAFVPDLLPRMDAEVAALGRSMSARTKNLEER